MTSRLKNLGPAAALAAFILVGGMLYKSFVPHALVYNSTPSLERGVYLASELSAQEASAAAYGQALCFRFQAPDWAKDRNYMPEGMRVCKPVAGLPGDELVAEGSRLTVRQARTGNTAHFDVLEKDSKGRDVQPALRSGTIPEGHVLLLSDRVSNSFDSRYIGLLPMSRLTHKVRLLVSTDEEQHGKR